MPFRYYSNMMTQASRGFAKGLFIIGLLLIGFGVLVYVFKEILAAIAAVIFVAVGLVCCFGSIKLFLQSLNRHKDAPDGRKNVRIRFEDNQDSEQF